MVPNHQPGKMCVCQVYQLMSSIEYIRVYFCIYQVYIYSTYIYQVRTITKYDHDQTKYLQHGGRMRSIIDSGWYTHIRIRIDCGILILIWWYMVIYSYLGLIFGINCCGTINPESQSDRSDMCLKNQKKWPEMTDAAPQISRESGAQKPHQISISDIFVIHCNKCLWQPMTWHILASYLDGDLKRKVASAGL